MIKQCPECGLQDAEDGRRTLGRVSFALCAKCEKIANAALFDRVNAHQIANEQPLSGGSNDYWKARVDAPVSGCDAYTAECNDLIEALQMTYAEGNVFKAVWRHALARRGIGKQGNTQLYEAEKAEFFAKRLVERAK